MESIVNIASGFMNLFTLGGEQFKNWVVGIVPTITVLLVLMNAIIALAGQDRVDKLARVCTSNPLLRYAVLPWVSAFMLGNPMALSMGKFMPEYYKPSYYASATYHCHTNKRHFPAHQCIGDLYLSRHCERSDHTGTGHHAAGAALLAGRYRVQLYLRLVDRFYHKDCRETAGCQAEPQIEGRSITEKEKRVWQNFVPSR